MDGPFGPRWIDHVIVEAIHFDLLRTHGGLHGLRDEDALLSAIARPRQLYSYAEAPDIAELAASLGYGLCRNHPFNDGNKRVSFVAMVVFAELNGYTFAAPQTEVVTTILSLAAGELTQAGLAQWLRERSTSIS